MILQITFKIIKKANTCFLDNIKKTENYYINFILLKLCGVSTIITDSNTMKIKSAAIIIAILIYTITLQAQTVTTFAGIAEHGHLDGPALTAKFSGIEQMAYDRKGNLLICDAANNCIRKIDATGNVSTFAGTGSPGFVNGNIAVAKFNNPLGIAIDNFDNIYVSDNLNFVIRKIDMLGNVTTYAGNGERGYLNGNSSNAKFDYINYLCLDNNNVRRKIDTKVNVSTIVGNSNNGFTDGIGSTAELSFPIAITYDKFDDVFYISDQGNSAIRKVLQDGTLSTLAGNGKIGHLDGQGTNSQFYFPKGITTDGCGNIYVAGRFDYTIRKIDKQGIVSTIAGIPHTSGNKNGAGDIAQFGKPISVIMSLEGNLLVSDWINNSIRTVNLTLSTSNNSKPSIDYGIQISPNPFSESTQIKINEIKSEEPVIIYLYDLTGKETKKILQNNSHSKQIILERGDLQNGLYLYRISMGDITIGAGKLMVE